MSDIIEEVRKFMKTITNEKVYYTLRKLRVKRISESTQRAVKIFLALRHFGVEIVWSNLFLELYGCSRTAALSQLHILGDKGVLTLVRGNKQGQLRYILSPQFLEHYNVNSEPKALNNSSEIG